MLQGFLTIITAAALTCCCPPANRHQPLPVEDKAASGAVPLTCPVNADPEPSPQSRPKHRPENLDLSRLSIRESGGYKTFLPEIGSLSPPPERAELLPEPAIGSEVSSMEGDSTGALAVDAVAKTAGKMGGSGERLGGSRQRLGALLAPGRDGSAERGRGSRERVTESEERAGAQEELRIAEMIKNADLSELQELLRSPVESSPDSPPPW